VQEFNDNELEIKMLCVMLLLSI